jgi:hypothetical protein
MLKINSAVLVSCVISYIHVLLMNSLALGVAEVNSLFLGVIFDDLSKTIDSEKVGIHTFPYYTRYRLTSSIDSYSCQRGVHGDYHNLRSPLSAIRPVSLRNQHSKSSNLSLLLSMRHIGKKKKDYILGQILYIFIF